MADLLLISSVLETFTPQLYYTSDRVLSLTNETWEKLTKALSLFEYPEVFITPDAVPLLSNNESRPPADINPSCKGAVLYNIYNLEMESFYPSIIYNFVKSGQLQQTKEVRIFCYLLKNRADIKRIYKNKEVYIITKIWLNYFYGKMASLGLEITSNEISGYAKELLSKCLELTDEWFHYSEDNFFFRVHDRYEFERKVKNLTSIPYSISNVDYAMFLGRKKYIHGNGSFTVKGIKIK